MALFTPVYTVVCVKSEPLVERSARTVPPHINTQTVTKETKKQYDWIYAAKRALETFDSIGEFDTLQILPYRQYAMCFMRGLQLLTPFHVKNRVNDLIFLCILEPTTAGVACAMGISKLSKDKRFTAFEINSKTVNFEQLLNHEPTELTFDIISEKTEYDIDSDSKNHNDSNNNVTNNVENSQQKWYNKENNNNKHAARVTRSTDNEFCLKSKEFAFLFLSKIRNEFTNNFVNELSNVLKYKDTNCCSFEIMGNDSTNISPKTENNNNNNNININKKEFNKQTYWKAIEIRDNLNNFGSFMYHQMKGHKCTKYKYESYANIEAITDNYGSNYNNSNNNNNKNNNNNNNNNNDNRNNNSYESLAVGLRSSKSLKFIKFAENNDFNEKMNENCDKSDRYDDAFNKIDESELAPEKILAQTEFINKKQSKSNENENENENNKGAKSETKNAKNSKNNKKNKNNKNIENNGMTKKNKLMIKHNSKWFVSKKKGPKMLMHWFVCQ